MSEPKLTKIEKLKFALHRVAYPTPATTTKAKYVIFGAAALSTALLFAACDGPSAKYPRGQGD